MEGCHRCRPDFPVREDSPPLRGNGDREVPVVAFLKDTEGVQPRKARSYGRIGGPGRFVLAGVGREPGRSPTRPRRPATSKSANWKTMLTAATMI